MVSSLKDINVTAAPFGLPELFAVGSVVGIQIWKRNSILSILIGTILYMALINSI